MKNQVRLAALAVNVLIPVSLSAQVLSFQGVISTPAPFANEIPDGAGPGPANWGAPLTASFTVANVTAPLADISVSATMTHGWVGDLEVSLIPPSGGNGFILFSRVGQSAATGDFKGSDALLSSDLDGNVAGTYTFNDHASGNFWAAAGFTTSTGDANFIGIGNIPPGSYRTSVPGPWDLPGNPNGGDSTAGQLTSFAGNSGFIGSDPNGAWTLRFRDGDGDGTVGFVYSATLDITPVPEPSAYALLTGLGLVGFAIYRRRRA